MFSSGQLQADMMMIMNFHTIFNNIVILQEGCMKNLSFVQTDDITTVIHTKTHAFFSMGVSKDYRTPCYDPYILICRY